MSFGGQILDRAVTNRIRGLAVHVGNAKLSFQRVACALGLGPAWTGAALGEGEIHVRWGDPGCVRSPPHDLLCVTLSDVHKPAIPSLVKGLHLFLYFGLSQTRTHIWISWEAC